MPVDKIVICHRDSNPRKPYGPKAIDVSVDSIVREHNGHASHTGPVWQPPPATPEKWGDIIPPFYYADDGSTKYFEGLNWSEGFELYQDDCQPPPEPAPETTLAVVKELTPPDSGKFALKINDQVAGGASAVGNQGTTGKVGVDPGNHTVSESPAEGTDTDLEDFTIRTVCRRGMETVAESNGPRVADVPVREGDEVTCVISNTLKPPPESKSVTPRVECVLFKDGQPDTVYWSYNNRNGVVVEIPRDQNTFEPDSANRPGKPPTTFLDGDQVGAFTTDFDLSGGKTLVWHLTGQQATASAESDSCNATTIEVRKVTVPANDPGKFNLLINNAVVATGGHGTTSGHLAIGAGEGTVRETAGPGTNLGDYTSRVECTNGAATRSAEGTKLDGKIAKGDSVVCTFTNTRKGTPPEPPQPLPPTPPDPDPDPVPPTPPGPAPQLDLVVTKSVAPETVVVGGRLRWTMIVSNR